MPLLFFRFLGCAVCFGDPASSQTQGLLMGILVLLAVLAVVLGGFASFFLKLRQRALCLPLSGGTEKRENT